MQRAFAIYLSAIHFFVGSLENPVALCSATLSLQGDYKLRFHLSAPARQTLLSQENGSSGAAGALWMNDHASLITVRCVRRQFSWMGDDGNLVFNNNGIIYVFCFILSVNWVGPPLHSSFCPMSYYKFYS